MNLLDPDSKVDIKKLLRCLGRILANKLIEKNIKAKKIIK